MGEARQECFDMLPIHTGIHIDVKLHLLVHTIMPLIT